MDPTTIASRNLVGKENTGNQHFLLFSQSCLHFQQTITIIATKSDLLSGPKISLLSLCIRSRSSDSKKVFPPVSPYGGISSWNEGAYVTNYPNYYKRSQSNSNQNSYDSHGKQYDSKQHKNHRHSKHQSRKYDSDDRYTADKHYRSNNKRETLQSYGM